jgi:hypothetical protein
MNDFAREAKKLEDELASAEAQGVVSEDPSADEILETLLSFSELMKLAQVSYNLATAQEKHTIASKAFSELTLEGGNLAGFRAKDGLDVLLNRGGVLSCGQDYLVSELIAAYPKLSKIQKEFQMLFSTSAPVVIP